MPPYRDIPTVIVPTRNRPVLLRRTLDSVRAQTYRPLEVIVVNDAGAPVPEVVGEYPDLELKYVEHAECQGLGAARNTGLANSEGRWVCFLDDDDTFMPEHVARLVTALRKGESRLVNSDFVRIFERRQPDGSAVVEEEQQVQVTDLSPERMYARNRVPVCCVMLDRECLADTGTFDASLPVLEDYDLWVRLLIAGHRFKHVPGHTVRVHTDLSGGQMTAERIHTFPATWELLYRRYAQHTHRVPGMAEEQQRFLRFTKWQSRLMEAFLKHSGGTNALTVDLGQVVYFRGFMAEVSTLLNEVNWGNPSLPVKASSPPSAPAATAPAAAPKKRRSPVRRFAGKVLRAVGLRK